MLSAFCMSGWTTNVTSREGLCVFLQWVVRVR